MVGDEYFIWLILLYLVGEGEWFLEVLNEC